jgi:hypothetical protein
MEQYSSPQSEQKRSFWQQHISNWQSSSQSQQAYCREHGIALATFGYWRHKLKKPDCQKPRFYPIEVVEEISNRQENYPNTGTGVRLVLQNNRFAIDIGEQFSERVLRNLIICLEAIQ